MKPHPRIIAIILNTNRRDDTLACLESLKKNTYPNLATIVMDNASDDGSIEAISRRYPDVEVIRLCHNLGYAGNNNVGISKALERGADWILVLNEDTILAPDCLNRLSIAGESDACVGIVGPMVYHFDEPDVIQSAGGMLGSRWESLHLGKNEPDRG